VTIPAGSCPSVGVSGLVLGGGHGVASRAYGLTCDNLTQATVITADGTQVTANASSHSDLFWALRGAGNGNFGVVTELQFRTHAAPQAVTAYMTWPWSKAAAVLKAWQEWGPTQPDEIWSSLHLECSPGRTPSISVACFSMGTYGELQNAVDRLAHLAGANASSVTLRRKGYEEAMEAYAGCTSFSSDAQCHLPGSTPGRSPQGALGRETYAARSDFFDRSLSAAGIQTVLRQIASVRGGAGSIAFTALGGAVNRVSPTATAFVHRRSRMLAQYIASWGAGASGSTAQSWLTSAHGAMQPYASGAAYQNYTDPTLSNWRKAYYGDAASRLGKVKQSYDPQRFFSYAQGL
jgi:FAD/FMN-containing dehydrogenase